MSEKGVLILAYGSVTYLTQALNLIKSIYLHNESTSICLVTTDGSFFKRFDKLLIKYIDVKIPLDLTQKLYLDIYSPFKHTLFIDSDCLVTGKLDLIFDHYKGSKFGTPFKMINTGEWYMNVSEVLNRLNLDAIPQLNGGMYYFEKEQNENIVFEIARKLRSSYSDIGLINFDRGGINEEPLISLSLAVNRIDMKDDIYGICMYTPLGIKSELVIDVSQGLCEFIKERKRVTPVILHFAGITNKFHYKREILSLNLGEKSRLQGLLTRSTLTILYQIEVFVYRMVKRREWLFNGKVSKTPIYRNVRY